MEQLIAEGNDKTKKKLATALSEKSSSTLEANLSTPVGEFFDRYSKVSALLTTFSKPNEAIEYFRASENSLLKELDSAASSSANKKNETTAVINALLALIYWLYPNHPGYDRIRNARKMLAHAFDAVNQSPSPYSESYVLGLLIELRVLPFLLRSKKATSQDVENARENSRNLIQKLLKGGAKIESYRSLAFRALLHEGLAFSYWQLERDEVKTAQELESSTLLFSESLKTAPMASGDRSFTSEQSRAINQFLSAFASVAHWDLGLCHDDPSDKHEGEERASLAKQARLDYEKSFEYAKGTTWNSYKGLSAYMIATSYATESDSEFEPRKIRALLVQATKIGEEALNYLSCWSTYEADFLGGSWIAGYYIRLADYSPSSAKNRYMLRSLELVRKAEDLLERRKAELGRWSQFQIGDIYQRIAKYYRQSAVTRRESSLREKLGIQRDSKFILEQLLKSLEYSTKSNMYFRDERLAIRLVEACLLNADLCYDLLNCELSEEDRRKYSRLGKRSVTQAESISKKRTWNEHCAQSNWILAQILDRESKYGESSLSYLKASGYYDNALKSSTAAVSKVYLEYQNYMQAWSRIELAKKYHRSSAFGEAAKCYHESSELIGKTKRWARRADLFEAESMIEDGEEKSQKSDDLQSSIASFQRAIERLSSFVVQIKKEGGGPDVAAFEALGFQLKSFCEARVILENSKQAYRIGNIDESLKGLSDAEEIFMELASNPVFSDSLRANELKSMASLCKALRSFQNAQLTGKHELYLDARNIFSKAASESKSKTLQPLLAGLASFATFLFYSKEIEKSLDTSLGLDLVAECDMALASAESSFSKLGNRSFHNMLKASKHVLDATIKMSAAEREVEREREKARLYSEARKSLSYASRYYELLGSSARIKEALAMISDVKSHQKLIPLAHDIIAEIASNQIIYTAISSSSVIEQTPGDSEKQMDGDYVTVEHKLGREYISLEDATEITFTITNLGRDAITTIRIDEVVPEGAEITDAQFEKENIEERSMKLELDIDPESSKEISVSFRPTSTGELVWHPSVVYRNSSKSYKLARGAPVRCTVESNKLKDFGALAREKKELDDKVRKLRDERNSLKNTTPPEQLPEAEEKVTEQIFTINERLSTIEEYFLKTKNEFQSLSEELEKVEAELASIDSKPGSNKQEEKQSLEQQRNMLKTKIDRRRLLLEQAQLL